MNTATKHPHAKPTAASGSLRQRLQPAWALATVLAAESASAQEAAVRSSLNRAIGLGTTVLFAVAAFMVLAGVVGAFWSMSQGDQDAKRKAMWAVGGGLGVGMASKIVQAMFDIGGGGLSAGG